MKTSFSNFPQHFQTCQESFRRVFHVLSLSKALRFPFVYLSSGEVSTLICEGMFALRGGWTMHLLPPLRVRSSAEDLSVKSKHTKSTFIQVHWFLLSVLFYSIILDFLRTVWGWKTPTGLCLLYIWKMGQLWWASCVRTHLQISAVTSLLSEILKIYTTAEKTLSLGV